MPLILGVGPVALIASASLKHGAATTGLTQPTRLAASPLARAAGGAGPPAGRRLWTIPLPLCDPPSDDRASRGDA